MSAAASLLVRPVKSVGLWVTQAMGLRQSDETLLRDAAAFWAEDGTDGRPPLNRHYRDTAEYDASAWLAIGASHLDLFRRFAAFAGTTDRPRRVIEWGCGGGANAVHFAPICDHFTGVDLADDTLAECAKQVATTRQGTFDAVKVAVDQPERALDARAGSYDLFLCTFVFELLPTQAYARRLLGIARDLLTPGGAAFVQFKYRTEDWRTRPRGWGYRRNMPFMCSWRVEEFWQTATDVGFAPRAFHLVPVDPLVNNGRYAYAFLTKRPTNVR